MDSLLATYASSDEEDEPQQQQPPPPPKISSMFSSLPKAQSSSFFSSLPSHKPSLQTPVHLPTAKLEEHSNPPSKSSALLSSLPTPRSQTTPDFHLPPPNKPKRVVQFRPPLPQPSRVDEDDNEEDEEDEEERERARKRQLSQNTSAKSFLSSMPIPKNSAAFTLGSGAASSTVSGRRSIIETEAIPTPNPTPSISDASAVNNEVGVESGVGNSHENWDNGSFSYNHEGGVAGDQSYADYGSSGGHDSYGNYAQYASGWNDASSGEFAAEASGVSISETSSFINMERKRRKGQIPMEIIEVKQDELIKNRPREDQSKLTGLAFGPSYQPAPSAKGKVSKLAKRKHQISSLFFDLKQKEMELAERRSKGLLTKAETQAKYGW